DLATMNEIINYLLGLDPSTEILSADVTFLYPIADWIIIFLLIIIAIYCHWVYKKEANDCSRLYRGTLGCLRFVIWAAVLLILLQPRIELDYLSTPKSNLAILIDTSKSMGLKDKSSEEDFYQGIAQATTGNNKQVSIDNTTRNSINDSSRYDILKQVLNNKKLNLVEQLEENYAVHFFAFDKNTSRIDIISKDEEADVTSIELPELTGDITQLGSALRTIPTKLRGLPLSAIIPFTDGANNRGEAPASAAQWLGTRDIPVYPVGLGAPESIDVGIVNIDLPDLVFKDDAISVRVTFEASSLEDMVLPVTLTLGDKEVGSGEVVAQNGSFQQDFVITPKEVGDLVFRVEVPGQMDEVYLKNNELKKRIRVIDSAIRILIAVDTPSWEYRYLKGFLATDERIVTKTFIRRQDIRTSRTREEYLEKFPSYETMQTKYDCVIFNNITADFFSNDQMKDIAKYVSEDGGSFIMISSTKGTPGTFIGTPIGDMLPVTLSKVSEDPRQDVDNRFIRPYKMRLTRDGYNHVVTRLHPLPEKNAEAWARLPGQFWYYKGIKRLKPSALALVEHSKASNEYGPIPLMAIQRYGRGNVLFNGFNSIWRWRYKIGNRFTNRFWGQTIQYMGLPHLLGNMKRVNFQTQGRDFTVGEKIPLTVRVLDRDFRPVTDEAITVIASNDESANDLEFPFVKEADKKGVFSGKMFLPEGSWTITVDGYQKEEEIILDINPPQYEFESPAMRINELKAIAEASGGEYVPLSDVWKIPDLIKDTSKKSRAQLKKDLWDTWLALLFVVICCALEWILRKRIDLA
ncbi:MAG: hypothetical protein HRU15_15650, partial [Planctomycetes bacterium]|nr:hypothetical protein [Planctomycetota bacterium]